MSLLRRARVEAYGLFDGPVQETSEDGDVPEVQSATLHQSVPFLAQSFDAVVVQQTANFEMSLASPEACTATANLLATLKPHGVLIYCGSREFAQMKQLLSEFPGKGLHKTLGNGGLLRWMLRLAGLVKPGLPALQFTIPQEPISRLEWHRLARQAVANLAAQQPNDADESVVDSPAA